MFIIISLLGLVSELVTSRLLMLWPEGSCVSICTLLWSLCGCDELSGFFVRPVYRMCSHCRSCATFVVNAAAMHMCASL